MSGDLKYEKCWAPMQQDVQGIIFVYDPSNPETEEQLIHFVNSFPKALKIRVSFCLCFLNSHNPDGAGAIPQCMQALDKFQGSAEDTQGIFTTFEKYLTKLIKQLFEK